MSYGRWNWFSFQNDYKKIIEIKVETPEFETTEFEITKPEIKVETPEFEITKPEIKVEPTEFEITKSKSLMKKQSDIRYCWYLENDELDNLNTTKR